MNWTFTFLIFSIVTLWVGGHVRSTRRKRLSIGGATAFLGAVVLCVPYESMFIDPIYWPLWCGALLLTITFMTRKHVLRLRISVRFAALALLFGSGLYLFDLRLLTGTSFHSMEHMYILGPAEHWQGYGLYRDAIAFHLWVIFTLLAVAALSKAFTLRKKRTRT